AEPRLATIFLGGEFGPLDGRMASASLAAYAPGLLGFILVKVLSPAYFARHDTRTPVRIGAVSLAVSLVLNVVFVLVLLATGAAPPHAGLAAATSCSALLNGALLFARLRSEGVHRSGGGWAALGARVLGAAAAMTAFLLV